LHVIRQYSVCLISVKNILERVTAQPQNLVLSDEFFLFFSRLQSFLSSIQLKEHYILSC